MPTTTGLLHQREALVLRHIAAENAQDIDAVLATFKTPCYDMRYSGRGIIESDEAVREYQRATFDAMAGVTYVASRLHQCTDAVIVEYRITGVPRGPYRGVMPSGAPLDCPAIAVFEFSGADLICERPYLDSAFLLAQMTATRPQA